MISGFEFIGSNLFLVVYETRGNKMKRLIMLLALVVISLNGCVVVPEHDHRDNGRHERHDGEDHRNHEGHGEHEGHDDEHGDH